MLKRTPSCTDLIETGLLRIEEALQRILRPVDPVRGYEIVLIEQAINRVLHQSIVSSLCVPAYSNSAVDGYAIDFDCIPASGAVVELPVVGCALAGQAFTQTVKTGQCIRIMTGAKIPVGVDTVIMQEHVEVLGQSIRLSQGYQAGQNIRLKGEDINKGETVLPAGRRCTPVDMGLMASLGISEVQVKRRLRVAVLSTGDELCTFGALSEAGIYDSNRFILMAMLQRLDIEVVDYGIIADDQQALKKAFSDAANGVDMLISSGGVSVGEADFTQQILAELGQIEFWKIAIKPGRPLAFGHIGKTVFFGLPGNPVAVMVTFYQFVLPALEKMMGLEHKLLAPTMMARSRVAIRKRAGRTEIQRGILEADNQGWIVRTTGKQGSGILRSMSLANAFIILDHEQQSIKPGDQVRVQPFAGLI